MSLVGCRVTSSDSSVDLLGFTEIRRTLPNCTQYSGVSAAKSATNLLIYLKKDSIDLHPADVSVSVVVFVFLLLLLLLLLLLPPLSARLPLFSLPPVPLPLISIFPPAPASLTLSCLSLQTSRLFKPFKHPLSLFKWKQSAVTVSLLQALRLFSSSSYPPTSFTSRLLSLNPKTNMCKTTVITLKTAVTSHSYLSQSLAFFLFSLLSHHPSHRYS